MSSHSSQQRTNRRVYNTGVQQHPDDSPPPLRGIRSSSMPISSHPDVALPQSAYPPQRRSSSPPPSQPQHVSPQNFTHPPFHPHPELDPEHPPAGQQQQQLSQQHTPPLGFPRPIQRIPPPPLLPPDSRFTNIEWAMTDQLLAEINRAAHDQDAIAPTIQIPKGPVIERERRDRSDGSPREVEMGGSPGSAGSGPPARSGSLRKPRQPQDPTPPRTPPLHQQPPQPQRPLPVVPDRSQRQDVTPRAGDHNGSPGYFPPHPSNESPNQNRDHTPPFRYDERPHIPATGAAPTPTKAKTPDRSLPVQEENEVEEDVTITQQTLQHERGRQQQEDRDTLKPRPIDHRLPTPKFSSSPMIPPDRIGANETSSELELSSTVQGDEYPDEAHAYDNEHDGRSSRAAHYVEDERPVADTVRHDGEDQEDTESYTPRSHHASLPQPNGTSVPAERVLYNAAAQSPLPAAHFHFRPRTASSDAAGMDNLDAAVLRDAIERLQEPPQQQQQQQQQQQHSHHNYAGPSSYAHTALPTRVPTAEEIRALVFDSRMYETWAQTIRPGAPVPPTPPYPATSFSPAPPPRSTPYPYGYAQYPSHHDLLHHFQQQQYFPASDSTFSPASTPYPTFDYSPFLRLGGAGGEPPPSMSLRSSPSHMPVPLNNRKFVKRKSVRRMHGSRQLTARDLPPRGESTEPRETSPEPSEGEEEEGEGEGGAEEVYEAYERVADGAAQIRTDGEGVEEGEGDWVDEEEDGEDDLLHLEYHPNYVVNPDKRRKRWELKWDALVKAFQALDRQTDSTLLLLALPTHGKTAYAVRSRSLRRVAPGTAVPHLAQIKSAFRALASARARPTRHMSLAERFERSSESSEDDLKSALGAALSSLSALSSIYESREQRWRAEMGRMGEERERVEVLLRQALGMGFGPGVM